MTRILFIALLCLCSGATHAINKCELDGKVTYTDGPCPAGKSSQVVLPQGPTTQDQQLARRQREREQKSLAKIEKAQVANDAREAKAAHERARQAALKKRKCSALDQRKKWLAEELEHASMRTHEKTKRRLLQAQENFDAACPPS